MRKSTCLIRDYTSKKDAGSSKGEHDLKKRIAVFLGGYLPAKKYGGPVTSIANLVDNLGEELDFYIISNDHDLNESARLPGIKEGWNEVGKAKVLYIPEKQYKKAVFRKILKEIKPDVVYLSSVFYYAMNFPAIAAAREYQIPIVLAPRGELCEGALQKGRLKKVLFVYFERLIGIFRGMYFHSTSEEETAAIVNILKIPESKVFQIPNMPCAVSNNRDKTKIPGILRAVFISRIVRKKNLLFAIQQIKRCEAKICFDIFGPIEDKTYWDECIQEIQTSPDNIRIQYLGELEPEEAKTIYQAYDVFIFPTLSENYGHVIVEAISSLCPVLLSKGTTPWDDIDGNGGFVIPLEDEMKWASTLEQLAMMDNTEYQKMLMKLMDYANKRLKTDSIKQEYKGLFHLE